MTTNKIPVITIDGPSGSGKGTVSVLLAKRLGWHYLDSGVLYRILAYAALQQKVSEQQEAELLTLIDTLDIQFKTDVSGVEKKVLLAGTDITAAIRDVLVSQLSSKISAIGSVRSALVDKQRSFCQLPGLVTDGRDMGTAIFPDADLKVYLTASAEIRAKRRFEQLKNKGFDGTLADLQRELEERDKRDQGRAASPLKPADDAYVLDSSNKDINQVLDEVLGLLPSRHILVE